MKDIFWFPEAVERDSAIDEWLHAQAPELGALARTWFARMRECGGPASRSSGTSRARRRSCG